MNRLGLLLLSLILTISVLTMSAIGCVENEPKAFTLIDDLGREVGIEGSPSRIVSLAPSNTEILFALGLEDKVCGVTTNCNYPAEAMDKEKVGGFTGIDIEKIVAIAPDLILAEDMHKYEVIPALERLGFTVIALVPHNLQEVMDSIELIGSITDTQDKAAQIVEDMQQRIQAITDITDGLTEEEKVSVLYIIWHEPIMSVGSDTRIHELIAKAGGTNIAAIAGEGYPTLALEEVININPQVIIVDSQASLDFVLNESRLSGVAALVDNRVYSIDPDLTNRPTPRIVEALEIMAEIIQPGIFSAAE